MHDVCMDEWCMDVYRCVGGEVGEVRIKTSSMLVCDLGPLHLVPRMLIWGRLVKGWAKVGPKLGPHMRS